MSKWVHFTPDLCHVCGDPMNEWSEQFPIPDENYQRTPGLVKCRKCFNAVFEAGFVFPDEIIFNGQKYRATHFPLRTLKAGDLFYHTQSLTV